MPIVDVVSTRITMSGTGLLKFSNQNEQGVVIRHHRQQRSNKVSSRNKRKDSRGERRLQVAQAPKGPSASSIGPDSLVTYLLRNGLPDKKNSKRGTTRHDEPRTVSSLKGLCSFIASASASDFFQITHEVYLELEHDNAYSTNSPHSMRTALMPDHWDLAGALCGGTSV